MRKTLLFAALCLMAVCNTITAQDYYVAGSSTLCGVNWVPGDEANKMTNDGDGTYSKTYANIAKGTHEFKITNGTWDVNWGGGAVDLGKSSTGLEAQNSAGNAKITTTADGDVTIHFDGTSIWIEGTFGEATIESVTIAWANSLSEGYADSESFAGTANDPNNPTNDMTLGDDNMWIKTYSNVVLEEGKYGYKVVGNHNWSFEFPGMNTYQDLVIEAGQAGTYTLTFTFNGDFKGAPQLSCTSTRSTALESTTATHTVRVSGRTILVSNPDITYSIHNLSGADVTHLNGSLTQGLYLVQVAGTVSKVMVK